MIFNKNLGSVIEKRKNTHKHKLLSNPRCLVFKLRGILKRLGLCVFALLYVLLKKRRSL